MFHAIMSTASTWTSGVTPTATPPIEGLDREGRRIVPNFCADVASVLDLKRRMLGCHASQRAWLARQHGIDDYLQQMDCSTRACGAP